MGDLRKAVGNVERKKREKIGRKAREIDRGVKTFS